MAYADLATIQATDPGDILTAAWCDQVRDNEEFLINPPICSVQGAAAVSTTSGAVTVLTAGTENFDNDSMHSTVTNPSRITIQTPGRYAMALVVRYAANSSGARLAQFLVNGTTQYNIEQTGNAGASRDTILSGSRKIVLGAGDYVEVRGRQDSGGALDITLDEFAASFDTSG